MTGKEQYSRLIDGGLATACEGYRRVEVGGRRTRLYQAQHESQRRPTTLRLDASHLQSDLLPLFTFVSWIVAQGAFQETLPSFDCTYQNASGGKKWLTIAPQEFWRATKYQGTSSNESDTEWYGNGFCQLQLALTSLLRNHCIHRMRICCTSCYE